MDLIHNGKKRGNCMKKFMSIVLVVVMMLSLVACSKQLSGTYQAEFDIKIMKYTASYTFKGDKVEITKKTNVFGVVDTTSFEGTYEIIENEDGSMEITISLKTEDDQIKSGTFSFEEGEGYIKIGKSELQKVS